ncbi:hypothetical protein UT300012_31710 [Paraclostridium bifermentans]
MSKAKINRFEVINNSVVTIAEKRGYSPVAFSGNEEYYLKIEINDLTKKQYKDILKQIEDIIQGEL